MYSQDLNWNTSAIPDNSTSFSFGSIGSPATSVTYAVTGSGSITTGPLRFTTTQGDGAWRSAITFAAVSDLKVYTFTFNPGICGFSFILYDIDGDNSNGDRAIVTADYSGSPQSITMTSLDASPPTITGSGTATATGTGTQGNQTDDRIQVTVPGCVTTLAIQYGNNPVGATGGRSFSIGNLGWSTSTLPVRFSQFTGQKITSGVIQLKWLSGNGININKYEIERSTDGQNFVSAGSITALNPAGSYSFNDHVATQGTLFYRIKESDLDTRFQYSPVIALHFPAISNPGITVFPNPTTQSLFITTNDNSIIEKIIIFDSHGKIVFQKSGPENKVDVSQFSSGLYLLKIIKKTGDLSASLFLKK